MDYEMPSVYKHDMRTAKKVHKCCECGFAIQPGMQYHYHHGVWDGRGGSYKVCLGCEDLRGELQFDMHHSECIPFEGLFDEWKKLDENRHKTIADFRIDIQSRRS
jgi:hypothetical protein